MGERLYKSALLYLFLIMLIGVILRGKFVIALFPDLDFNFLLQSHSHVAFLGWVYIALIGLVFTFSHVGENKGHPILFTLLHIANIGMLISFALEGYAFWSILFATLHIFISYYVFYLFLKERKKGSTKAHPFFLMAFIFNIISSIGPWGLAYSMSGYTGIMNFFDAALYFYLHFQYNGWFTLGIMGAIYALLEKLGISYSKKWMNVQFWLSTLAVIPTYFLSIMWLDLSPSLILIAQFGGILYFVGITMFLLNVTKPLLSITASWVIQLTFSLGLLSLAVKGFMELMTISPSLAKSVYEVRQIIIGYLHLTLLGFVTFLLLAIAIILYRWKVSNFSLLSIILGSSLMIILLFLTGLFQWIKSPVSYSLLYWLLFISSIFPFIGAGVLLFHRKSYER
ncbi:hypothetical protein L1765_03905 [Microaerobacter geothermalis]|uniref:hypothetical protein n=1 Tax=Microaerobacter geothermalis TaxID=674972 RepID=UPI001F16068E|nr:hypothetical protein [Microaerobacter geothermalis]MCF6093139.1 hypothetical protein [Microaerobacter geothermalis]